MMLDRPVVLILGAGASNPYGFPLASELREEALTWRADRSPRDPLHKIGFDDTQIEAFLDAFEESQCASVDHFLQTRAERYWDIGLATLATILIKRENPEIARRMAPGRWYGWLLDNLGTSAEDFDAAPLTIATFNYDRSLEFVLVRGLHQRYNVPVEDASRIVSKKVIHLYGDLGQYPGTGVPATEHAYAAGVTPVRLRLAMSRMKLIRRGAGRSDEFNLVRERVSEAVRVKFLGFGYHPINVELLAAPEEWEKWGANKGISGTMVNKARYERGQIERLFGSRLSPSDQSVFEFLHDNGL